jgi:hypothetical protein
MEIKIGDDVQTQHGKGVVVDFEELPGTVRYAVELIDNPFPFSPVFYWPKPKFITKLAANETTESVCA